MIQLRSGLAGLACLAAFTSAPVMALAAENQPPMVGLANPASQYCASLGGKLEMRTTPEGQVGYCHLPDGRIEEEWALFRANHPQPGDQDTPQHKPADNADMPK
ncbi:putative hemolysin [Xanthobacter sp. TB0139]|uniref:putative hemolysin n=1 Tax=Xanthobacter sp. TB0139 TaxID=3459178 RepID=UPI00403A77AB